MNNVLSFVRKSLLQCWKFSIYFGLLGELHLGVSVPFEEHDLQYLEKMALVRSETFQFPSDIHHRCPR